MRQFERPDGYVVYDNGDIKGLHGKLLKPWSCNGYMQVRLQGVTMYVHRLVAECFVDNPLCLPEVNHKDGIKAHNWADNLEWNTRSENIQHSFDNALQKPKPGSSNGNSKLTDEQVYRLRLCWPYRSVGWIKQKAAEYGVHPCTIVGAATGKTYMDAD